MTFFDQSIDPVNQDIPVRNGYTHHHDNSHYGLNEQIGIDSSKSAIGKFAGFMTGVSGSAQDRALQQQQSDHAEHYKTSDDFSITADQQNRFNHDQNILSNYSKTH